MVGRPSATAGVRAAGRAIADLRERRLQLVSAHAAMALAASAACWTGPVATPVTCWGWACCWRGVRFNLPAGRRSSPDLAPRAGASGGPETGVVQRRARAGPRGLACSPPPAVVLRRQRAVVLAITPRCLVAARARVHSRTRVVTLHREDPRACLRALSPAGHVLGVAAAFASSRVVPATLPNSRRTCSAVSGPLRVAGPRWGGAWAAASGGRGWPALGSTWSRPPTLLGLPVCWSRVPHRAAGGLGMVVVGAAWSGRCRP